MESNHLSFSVLPNYLSPIRAKTRVSYFLPQQMNIRIDILNIVGKRVHTLFKGTKEEGTHNEIVDASFLKPGVYIYRLSSDAFSLTKKLIIVA
ncbi:MAG: T9SS type A sorting domain-containing protein [Balneolales bacterium]|nr:T9SS type A sorting domain-containing protein [Balneolales bacterium]